MKKYIQSYMDKVQGFMDLDMKDADIEKIREVLSEFEIKITYFQHERLIHLIVTVLFAILEVISIALILTNPSVPAIILSALFLVLVIPYVMHYYFLENSVQHMYKMRDQILEAIKEKRSCKP